MKKVALLVLLFGICFIGNVYAENNYPYKNVCPVGPSGVIGGIVFHSKDYWTDDDGGYYVDKWRFAQCNCTSYVAYRLNNPFDDPDIGGGIDNIYGVSFRNGYLGQRWGNGGQWGVAAKRAGIPVDDVPIPGDAVYFVNEAVKGSYGHIEFVGSVDYDENMNWRSITTDWYNAHNKHKHGTRTIIRGSKDWMNKPKGFIHLLAAINPEFYFNYYDLGYDFAGQTKEEWEYIYALVMKKYYKGNDSKYTSAFQGVWTDIGGELPVGFGGAGGSYTPPTGNYTSNGSGATEHSQPGESDHQGYVHNVSMDDTEMDISGVGNYNHEWTFYHGEVPTVNIRVRLKNKTNHKIGRNDVTIKWFESPNHTFNPQYDHHFATDHNKKSIGPFKHHSHSDELVERKTGITHLQTLNPGVYYIYPVFYYNGEENMASEHDHDEYIKVTILPRYDVENVSFNSDKTTVTVGEGLTLSATVKNNYDSLPHDVRVGFYINGGLFNHKLFYAKVFTPADLGTQSFTVPALAPATPGRYTISMEVDDENKLAEKNESNNRRSFVLTVDPQPIDGAIDTNYGSTDPNNPKTLTETLTEGHCFSGTPTTLLGMGVEGNPWEWTCQGENGGTDETGYAVLEEEETDPRADVNGDGYIDSSDVNLVMMYSLGFDMSGTGWVDSSTTGDVNCDNTTNTTDAMLISRYVNGGDMAGTGWCAE